MSARNLETPLRLRARAPRARESRARGSRTAARPAASHWAAACSIAAMLGLGGCMSVSLDELDVLNRSLDLQTILIRERFTLYSPFDEEFTTTWIGPIEEELEAVSHLLEAEGGVPVSVLLEQAERSPEGDTLVAALENDAIAVFIRPGGLQGWASGDTVVLRVFPPVQAKIEDQEPIQLGGPETYRTTLRHELAHAFARRLDLRDDRWFSEGVAELIESLEMRDGILHLTAPPDVLAKLHELPPEERELRDLLRWEIEDPTLEIQPPARQLAHSFLRFLMQDIPIEGGDPALQELSSRRDSELLPLEAAWWDWLESL